MLSVQKQPICSDACCAPRIPAARRWQPCVNFSTLEGAATGVKQVCYVFTALQTRSDENSVCPSVKRVHCDKTEERSVQILTPNQGQTLSIQNSFIFVVTSVRSVKYGH